MRNEPQKKKHLKNAIKNIDKDKAIQEISKKIKDMHWNRGAMEWTKDLGLNVSDEMLKDLLNQAEIDDMIRNLK